MFHNTIIIGAGASGLTAAISLRDNGCDVALLEGTDRIGKKILSTGNGRCNISNENISPKRYHSDNIGFPDKILTNFDLKKTTNFFNSIGLSLTTLDQGKMYPLCLQASAVVDLLKLAVEERGIPTYINSKAQEIKKKDNKFLITTTTGEIFECYKLVLACGGKSATNTGSDGSGFVLAKQLGHSIINPIPAIVQLKLNYKHLKPLSGIKFDGFAEIFVESESIRKEFGEILFTDYGISGPPILQLSRIASYYLSKKNSVILKVDMLPNISKEILIETLENHWGTFSYRSVFDSFIGILNKKIIPILLKEANIKDIYKPCYDLNWKEKIVIFNLLKEWTFNVTDTNSFNNAQVTAGGVDTLEVNPSTLESKISQNLFFCGEILDVDGDCGGFNLQWAWSSGLTISKSN